MHVDSQPKIFQIGFNVKTPTACFDSWGLMIHSSIDHSFRPLTDGHRLVRRKAYTAVKLSALNDGRPNGPYSLQV